MSEAAKTEILALLDQIAEKLGLPPLVPTAGRKRQNMGQASKGYVQECINAAKMHPDVPSGSINVKKLENKLVTCNDIQEVLGKMLPMTIKLINIDRLQGQDLMFGSNSIKESVEREAPNRAELKPVAEQLRKRYDRASTEDKEAEKAAKNSSTSNLNNLSL